ncbi:MAG: hypothetical protein FJX61_08365 [Alphaproteobacteria bacterium]|nr:hypothetical protein [Alphaproteobacteria bacterium]
MTPAHGAGANTADVRAIFGDLDDETVAAVLATGASHAELVEAEAWLGAADAMGELEKPMPTRVARVLAILDAVAARDDDRDQN